MNEAPKTDRPQRGVNEWASAKVADLVRRAAIAGAADLQRLAARLLSGAKP